MPTPGIIGHQTQRQDLLNDLKQDNVAHAYLFVGPKHVGKFTVAKWFATELLTHDAGNNDRHDLERRIEQLIHPDLLVIDRLWMDEKDDDLDELSKYTTISQQHRSKAKTKSDVIGVEDVRVLQERLNETHLSRYRVVLIRRIERMQAEGVNALLKMLEEPPHGLVFILTTDDMNLILPTIISRSRVVRFSRVPSADLEPLVSEFPNADRAFITDIAQGSPGFVIRMAEHNDVLKNEKQFAADADAFWKASTVPAKLKLLDRLNDKGEDADRYLIHLGLAIRRTHIDAARMKAFLKFAENMETNVNRQLLSQSFVFSVSEPF